MWNLDLKESKMWNFCRDGIASLGIIHSTRSMKPLKWREVSSASKTDSSMTWMGLCIHKWLEGTNNTP